MNRFKTFMLLFALTLLFMAIGQWLGGYQGLITAFLFAGIMNFVAFWFSDKIVLAMYGAKEIKREENPQLYEIVETLTRNAKLPMPKIYRMAIETPNAFATGRDPAHAAVAVTDGIVKALSRDELAGVIAHELSHIKNRDTLISVIAATIAGAIMMIANMARWAAIFGGRSDDDDNGGAIGFLLMVIVAPLAAMLIQMAISRTREYQADASGADISGKPLALAGALRKLEEYSKRVPFFGANPSTSHLFIVNPLRGGGVIGLFSTHPPITERIKRLEQIAQEKSPYKVPKIIY